MITKEVVKVTNIENDIKNYLSEYDAGSEMLWDNFADRIKILSQNLGFDFKGQSLNELLVFIFLRKMLNPDFILIPCGKFFSFKTCRIYLLTIIKAFETIGKMKNFPDKAALKLITVMLEVLSKLSLINIHKNNFLDDKKNVTERRFELLKAQLKPGMTDKEIKQKIFEVTELKDPKSRTKYLEKWRDWEKQLYESTKQEIS